MTKAFANLRVSGKAQIKGDGFARQQAAIKAYAAEHSISFRTAFEGVIRYRVVFLGYALGVILLLNIEGIVWIALAFPMWVLLWHLTQGGPVTSTTIFMIFGMYDQRGVRSQSAVIPITEWKQDHG